MKIILVSNDVTMAIPEFPFAQKPFDMDAVLTTLASDWTPPEHHDKQSA